MNGQVINPSVGDRVELPTDIGRIDTFYDDGGPLARLGFRIGVVGNDETIPSVLLKTDLENPDVADGATVLASDVNQGDLWYAVDVEDYE